MPWHWAMVEKFSSTNDTHVGPLVLRFQSSVSAAATVPAKREPRRFMPA
eukprot:CAMPEP_0171231960 /NCGR_PEP_ID=MMETSP0790-20130122/40164_1 /TAXON_ID=2925 /ORGANISM="Alexandrium catenella, Strain OF101" /LENGTH=48 /DNA_ID= /DNA_START= /DNA_END= /DNA_ORIENTATION=